MRALTIMTFCTALAACAMPAGDQSDPEQAYYYYVAVRTEGDLDKLWEFLHPDIRADFDIWHTAESQALALVESGGYPEDAAVAAKAALDGGRRAKLADGRALFKQLATAEALSPLGTLESMSAHVRSTSIADDGVTARIRTYGGDELTFVHGGEADDRWFSTLPADELERLKNARKSAERNLKRVKRNLDKALNNE